MVDFFFFFFFFFFFSGGGGLLAGLAANVEVDWLWLVLLFLSLVECSDPVYGIHDGLLEGLIVNTAVVTTVLPATAKSRQMREHPRYSSRSWWSGPPFQWSMAITVPQAPMGRGDEPRGESQPGTQLDDDPRLGGRDDSLRVEYKASHAPCLPVSEVQSASQVASSLPPFRPCNQQCPLFDSLVDIHSLSVFPSSSHFFFFFVVGRTLIMNLKTRMLRGFEDVFFLMTSLP